MLSCRVQSAISQRFVCFSGYRWLELDDLITHGFERAPPTHNVAGRPIIIFALTFKARHPVNICYITLHLHFLSLGLNRGVNRQ